jgi:hypothetical protein
VKNAEKNRDPERAQKRAAADAKCAWRKMGKEQRVQFVRFMVENQKEESGSLGCTEDQEHGFEDSELRVWFGWASKVRIAERRACREQVALRLRDQEVGE